MLRQILWCWRSFWSTNGIAPVSKGKPALPKRGGITSLTVLYAFPYCSRFINELAGTLITQTSIQAWDKIQFHSFCHILYRSSACKNCWASTKDLMMDIPLRFLDLISYQLFPTFDASCLCDAIIILGKDRKMYLEAFLLPKLGYVLVWSGPYVTLLNCCMYFISHTPRSQALLLTTSPLQHKV
jgi:hypothetical protein